MILQTGNEKPGELDWSTVHRLVGSRGEYRRDAPGPAPSPCCTTHSRPSWNSCWIELNLIVIPKKYRQNVISLKTTFGISVTKKKAKEEGGWHFKSYLPVWFIALWSRPFPTVLPACLALLGKGWGWRAHHHRQELGAEQRSVPLLLLEPARWRPDELELNAIFVRVPFPSMNANPELQAIRMTSWHFSSKHSPIISRI